MWGKYVRDQAAVFAMQFERLDGRLVYRRNGRGEAYPVTAEERDAFVAEYARSARRLMWGTVIAMLAVVAVSLVLTSDSPELVYWAMGSGLVITLAALLSFTLRAFTAPHRKLMRRAAIAAPLTPAERDRRWSDHVSWGTLGLCTLVVSVVIVMRLANEDILHGWGRFWLLLPAVFAGAMGWAAWRKWRIDRVR